MSIFELRLEQMWLLYSILASLFFATVHILDSFCVDDIFEKPWMGMITSACASLIAFAPLPYVLPFVSWSWPEINIIAMALAAGALFQFSHFLYFQALSYSQAGIVAAYWNLIPVFTPLISFVVLNQLLSPLQYLGIIVLVSSSTYMLSLDDDLITAKKAFTLMLAASSMQACAYLLLDHVYLYVEFVQGYLIMLISVISVGMSPLLFSGVRTTIKASYPSIKRAASLIISIEIFYLVALASAQKAISLGDPSLVSAVETTMPAFIFFLSTFFILSRFTARFSDPKSSHWLPQKMISILFMSIGVWLVA